MKRLLQGIVVLLLTAMGSCTTMKYVPVERVRTDTLIQTQVVRDSVFRYDSIHVKETGDTVWVEKWHTLTKWQERHDTVYQATHDTIPEPYPVEKKVEVEKPLTWWQRVRLTLGDIALILGGIILLAFIVKESVPRNVRG